MTEMYNKDKVIDIPFNIDRSDYTVTILSFDIHDFDDRRVADTMKRHDAVSTGAIPILLCMLD